jgi:hypothetical protein
MRGGARRFIDMTGRNYGRLHVLYRAKQDTTGTDTRPAWVCKCACGNTTVVLGANLRTGMTRSCGCLRREVSALNGRKRKAKAVT